MKRVFSFIREENKKTFLRILLIIWCLIVLGAVLLFIFTRGKVFVEVKYAPFSAVVKLNDTVIMNNNGNYITPGEYTITVEYKNFKTLEGTVVVDNDTKYLFGNLIPLNDEGEEYMNKHIKDFSEVERIASIIAGEDGVRQREQYPIIDKLPIKDPYYTIGYTISDDGILSITIRASVAYRQLAVNKVLEITEDDDFEKYDVIFYDLDNPFSGKFKDNNELDPVEYLKSGFSDTGFDFSLGNGKRSGDYYYTFLRHYGGKYVNEIYRVVLKKNGIGWKLAGEPYPLLTAFNTVDVPIDIINDVNKL